MLGIDWRAARVTWTAVVVLASIYILYLLRKTLFVFIISVLLAYLLSPLVELLNRLLPASRTRTPALALAYAVVIAVLVLLGMQIGTRVVDQANALAQQFPQMLANWERPSAGASPAINSIKAQVIDRIQEQLEHSATQIISALPRAGVRLLSLAGDLVYLVVIPVVAFFFLKDGEAMRRFALGAIENGRAREIVQDMLADVHVLLAHYIRVLVILSVATFIAYSACFAIVGVPYTILLAVLAALLEFIPMIGPLVAAVLVVIVAGVSGVGVIPILIFMGAYRLFQDYVLTPHIMGSGVEMHPLAVLFGVFAGTEIAGIPGAFLSVPVLALIRIVYRRVRKHPPARVAPVPSP